MRYVVAYDVEDDRTRDRVANVMERFGKRVQKSVFECVLEAPDLELMTRQLKKELGKPEGASVRIYRLCADCLDGSFGLGEIRPGFAGEPWLVI